MDTLGKRIDIAITESQTDPAAIAKACGISVQAVYAWMRDEVKNLKAENLFALADITGFEARWIGTGEGPQRPGGGREKRLVELYKQLDDRGKDAVYRVAEAESSYIVGGVDKSKTAA